MTSEKKNAPKTATDLLVAAADRVNSAATNYRNTKAAMLAYREKQDALDKAFAEAQREFTEAKSQMNDAMNAMGAGE